MVVTIVRSNFPFPFLPNTLHSFRVSGGKVLLTRQQVKLAWRRDNRSSSVITEDGIANPLTTVSMGDVILVLMVGLWVLLGVDGLDVVLWVPVSVVEVGLEWELG